MAFASMCLRIAQNCVQASEAMCCTYPSWLLVTKAPKNTVLGAAGIEVSRNLMPGLRTGPLFAISDAMAPGVAPQDEILALNPLSDHRAPKHTHHVLLPPARVLATKGKWSALARRAICCSWAQPLPILAESNLDQDVNKCHGLALEHGVMDRVRSQVY